MMVYVWTLSDPETRVKIQGDSLLPPRLPRQPQRGIVLILPAPARHAEGPTMHESQCESRWPPFTRRTP